MRRPSGDKIDGRCTVRILGTHGVPASYGGFETAAEHVALHLVEAGWRVVVYCQERGRGDIRHDVWNDVERVIVPVDFDGWLATGWFDLRSVLHAARQPADVWLTFGYNTAGLNVVNRVLGIPLLINMDGIEWSRAKWGPLQKTILYANERIACAVGDVLIADHPEIEKHLISRVRKDKLTTVTYGAHDVTDADVEPVRALGLEPGRFMTVICRPVPENSLLEIVGGFSAERRDVELAVLGSFDPDDDYHRAVMNAASGEVRFLGSIYEPETVSALRFHSLAYIHGHTVGGTNPSLVEALGAGNPIIAHDNRYNRWTAGAESARFFRTASDVSRLVGELVADPATRHEMSEASRLRFRTEFTWDRVASLYEKLLAECAR